MVVHQNAQQSCRGGELLISKNHKKGSLEQVLLFETTFALSRLHREPRHRCHDWYLPQNRHNSRLWKQQYLFLYSVHYEMYRDFQENTINSDGSFGMWVVYICVIYVGHELYSYFMPWYWNKNASCKNGE